MKRSVIFLCLLSAVVSTRLQAQEVLAEDVAPPFVVPMTEGLFRIFSAEPLGKKGFNIRYTQYQVNNAKSKYITLKQPEKVSAR